MDAKRQMTYNLPDNYQARLEPQYFNDTLTDSIFWQADVYRLAAILARKAGVKRIFDIGCGRGGKLISLANEFEIVGVDYGENIEYCKQAYPTGIWNIANLEIDVAPAELFKDSVVICADVIEHLIDPTALIETLRNATETAAYVLVSTPDRKRLYGFEQSGPPDNLAHVREWTLKELESWFLSERLPIIWQGWTVSYDKQPERVNTSLVILSSIWSDVQLPISFQPARQWDTIPNPVNNNLLKVWMTPTFSEAGRDITNAINQIVVRVNKYLPDYGVQLVESENGADIRAGHAGQGSQQPLDVAHYHGLYLTSDGMENSSYFAINKSVIHNLKTARIITAPSEWIADVIRRDMHVNPRVIGWGVDTEEWKPSADQQDYVIWNKARVDHICNPQIMLDLAARAHDTLFLTTFGIGTPNVMTIGRQPYEVMKQHVRHAAVYLSTNVETFGIGTLEAMAAGIPILAFRQGNTDQLVEHGVTGFLAELGDMDGLHEGLKYCMEYRKRLGANAREAAKRWTWQRVAEQFASVYHEVMELKNDVRSHQIDESLYKGIPNEA